MLLVSAQYIVVFMNSIISLTYCTLVYLADPMSEILRVFFDFLVIVYNSKINILLIKYFLFPSV